MNSYVINLDRSPERLEHFLAQASGAGIEVTRIAAVDGGAMTVEERSAASSRQFQFQPLNPGELGVFLSHRAVWRALIASGAARAANFEADARLGPPLGELVAALDASPPAADIIKLETTLRPVALSAAGTVLGGRYRGQSLGSWHGGTAGYIITRDCAGHLLGLTDPIADTVDQVLFNPLSRVSRTLKLMQVSPGPCVQYDILYRAERRQVFATTIGRSSHAGRIFHHGPLIDGRRAVQRLAEVMLREIRGRTPGNHLQVVAFSGAAANLQGNPPDA